MNSLNPSQNEELRHVVLEVLSVRHPTAHPLHAVRRRIDKDHLIEFAFGDDALTAALHFLTGLGLVIVNIDGLGSTSHYSATALGVLAHERGTIPKD